MPPQPNNSRSSNKGFTLLELLIVVAIIAVLSVLLIVLLDPAQMFKQTRDATRLSDVNTLKEALLIAQSQGLSMGTANKVYVSVPDASSTCGDLGFPALSGYSYSCAPTSTLQSNNGTGWIPVDFSNLSLGQPISYLPIDPINTTSSYYSYVANSSAWVFKVQAFESNNQIALNPNGLSTGNGYGLSVPVYVPPPPTPPTITISSAVERGDSSGIVDVSFAVNDLAKNFQMAKMEYVAGSGCNFSSPNRVTINESPATYYSNWGSIKIYNVNDYQISTPSYLIRTDFGANTVVFQWPSKTDLPSTNGTYCLRVTAKDSTNGGIASATQTLVINN